MSELMVQAAKLAEIMFINIILSGDNAIVIGMTAAAMAPEIRSRVIFWGMAVAVVLRIVFAIGMNELLHLPGVKLAGGLLLAWVCWRMWQDMGGWPSFVQLVRGTWRRFPGRAHADSAEVPAPTAHAAGDPGVSNGAADEPQPQKKTLMAAIWQITLADVSMSLDNVLAVVAAARGDTMVLIIGLAVSIVMMAVLATVFARLIERYPTIAYIGLAIIVIITVELTIEGAEDVLHRLA